MKAKVDSVGRVVLPKAMREALGLGAGSSVDITVYGEGLHLTPVGRTARLVSEDGVLVAESDTEVDDETMFGLLDARRR